jgi:hypothetical protein
VRALLAPVLLGLLLVAASCGPKPAASATPKPVVPGSVADQQAVRHTVEAFYHGIIYGDARAVCALMTPAERAAAVQGARAEGGTTCTDWVTEARAADAADGVMPPVQIGVGQVEISGNHATVEGSEITIVTSGGMENNVDGTVDLLRVDGRWRIDAG